MIAGLIFTLLAQAAQATPAPTASSTVVVTGRKPGAQAEVRRLVRAVTPVGDSSEPLARFDAPVCPTVDGFVASASAAFINRMREDAAGANIAVGKPGCEPNMLVVFVDNGQATVHGIRHHRPELLGDLSPAVLNRLEHDTGPVHVWAFTELRSRDGNRLRGPTTTSIRAPELKVDTASYIQSPTRTDLTGVILLFDQSAVIGKTVHQLADYAAMRMLAQTNPSHVGTQADTILTLFAGDEALPPRELTDFDRGYLKGLYHGLATEAPFDKTRAIARTINEGR